MPQPYELTIADGTPIWNSAAIVPSTSNIMSPITAAPTTVPIQSFSTDVSVYVDVQNTGTDDLGVCSCAAVDTWSGPIPFAGFINQPMGSTNVIPATGYSFDISDTGDTLHCPGGLDIFFGGPTTGRRAWALSPDLKYFAYVFANTPPGSDWNLSIVALADMTRSDGTPIPKGSTAISANGTFANPMDNTFFSWAESKAVLIQEASGNISNAISLVCPESIGSGIYTTSLSLSAGNIVWAFLISKCGKAVALVPKRQSPTSPGANFSMVSTSTSLVIQFTQNNAPVTIATTGDKIGTGNNQSIKTNSHTANGVTVNTGNGTTILVDDPDCAFIKGILVHVDRVMGSTMPGVPSAGVVPVGDAALGPMLSGQGSWIEVPNPNGWNNMGVTHWCLLAEAYTNDGKVPKPWDGTGSFPLSKTNCAQLNVYIS